MSTALDWPVYAALGVSALSLGVSYAAYRRQAVRIRARYWAKGATGTGSTRLFVEVVNHGLVALQVYQVSIAVPEFRGVREWRSWRRWWHYDMHAGSGPVGDMVVIMGYSTELIVVPAPVRGSGAWEATADDVLRLRGRRRLLLTLGNGRVVKPAFAKPPYPTYETALRIPG